MRAHESVYIIREKKLSRHKRMRETSPRLRVTSLFLSLIVLLFLILAGLCVFRRDFRACAARYAAPRTEREREKERHKRTVYARCRADAS